MKKRSPLQPAVYLSGLENEYPVFFFNQAIASVVLLLLTALSIVAAEQENEQAIVKLTVNGYDAGEFFVEINEQDDVLVQSDLLTTLRLKKALWAPYQAEYISLSQLSPQLSYSIDQTEAALVLDVDPEWFEIQEIGRRQQGQQTEIKNIISGQPVAAFWNYSLDVYYQEDQNVDNFSLPLEMGVNHNNWFFFNSLHGSCNDGECDTSRLKTNITYDIPEKLRRWTIGDINPRSMRLQRNRMLGGVSLESRFVLDRFFDPYPDARLETIIERPVTAELIRNGQVVEEWELLPGPVNFYDLFGTGGEELLLRDTFGREQHLDLPTILGGQAMLRKGVHEFSYNLGLVRDEFGQDNEDYSDPIIMGFHRYGVNDRFTPGAVFSLQEDSIDLGAGVSVQLGNRNLISLETFYRNNHGENNYGLTASHTVNLHPFSLFLSWQYTSEEFYTEDSFDGEAPDTEEGTGQKLRSLGTGTARFFSQQFGNVSLGISSRYDWDKSSERSTVVNFTYNIGINKYLSLSASLRHPIEGTAAEDTFFLGLTFIPHGSKADAYMDNANYHYIYSEQDGHSHDLTVQKSAGRGTGTGSGYRLKSRHEEEGVSLGGKYTYRDERAVVTASLRQPATGDIQGDVGLAGSVVTTGNGLHLGRPVTDGFTVVRLDKADGLDSVPIKHNNALVGKIDPGSSLVVPGVLSHQENELSIYSSELPIDFFSLDDKKYVEVDNRGGASLTFTVTRFTAVEGNVYLATAAGEKKELNSLPIEFVVNKEKRIGFIGINGYFYIENLPMGEHVLRVLRFEGDCEARLSVIESEDIVTNLGEIACVPVDKLGNPRPMR